MHRGGAVRLRDRLLDYNDVPGPVAAFSRVDVGYWIYPVPRFSASTHEVMCTNPALLDGGNGTLFPLVNFDYLASTPPSETAAPFSPWISELSLFWIWELLSITAIAAVVGLTTLPELLRRGSSLKERILGRSTFGSLRIPARLGIAVVSSAALAGAILAVGNTGGGDNSTVVLRSALLFGVLLVACAFLDRQREGHRGHAKSIGDERA